MSINKSYIVASAIIASASIAPISNISYVMAESQIVVVSGTKTGSVNFRVGPSKEFDVIQKLDEGTQLKFLEQVDDWTKVDYNGTVGYVHNAYLASSNNSAEVSNVTTARLNLRTGPSTSYPIIYTIDNGQAVEVISVDGSWAKIKHNGTTGYAYKIYISGITSDAVEEDNSDKIPEDSSKEENSDSNTDSVAQTTTKYANAEYGLNVRSGPSKEYSIVGMLSYGQKVTVISINDGWAKIEYNGTVAYASDAYLQSNKPSDTVVSGTNSEKVDAVIAYAKSLLGKKYVWGAQGPNTFDCTGFTYYVYKVKTGIILPRASSTQCHYGEYVSKSNLKPGDLVFFDTIGSNNGNVSHAGMYLGEGQFIHASSSKGKVVISDLTTGHYCRAYVNARRVL